MPVTLVSNSISPLSLVEYFNGNLKLWIPTCCISTGEPWIKEEGPFCKSGNVSISSFVGIYSESYSLFGSLYLTECSFGSASL